MSRVDRLSKVEEKLDAHLRESGEVREAIRALHQSVETISSRMWGAAVGSLLTLVSVVGFLLKVTLWK